MTLEDEIERRDPPPQVTADSPPLHLGPAAPGPTLNNRPLASFAQPTHHNRSSRPPADEHTRSTEERDSQRAQAHRQSQHGPVAVPLVLENPGSCPPPQPPRPLVGTRARPALRTQIPEPWAGRPAGPPVKRHSASENSAAPPLGSPLKKPRLIAPGSLPLPLPHPDPTANARSLVTSPLFFSSSSSPRHPISRPPSVPVPAIGLSMMGENEHPDGVTTLRLPKGQVSATSPARSSGTPRSWSSAELSSVSRSPDSWPQPSIIQLLQGIGMVELLELDERPTCIIDLNDQANSAPVPLHLVYANAALRTAPVLLELLQADPADPGLSPDFPAFKTWVFNARERSVSSAGTPSITYSGIVWTYTTLRRRFRIIRAYQDTAFDASAVSSQATESLPSAELGSASPWKDQGPDARRERERSDYFGPTGSSPTQLRSRSEPRSRADSTAETVVRPFDDLVLQTPSPPRLRTTFDWTQIPIDDPNLSAHHRFARSIDWASTPLGPVEAWPLELRIMSSMIMGSPHPAALYWGKDYVAIYNEAYLSLAAGKHPRLMGQRYQDAWPEIWDEVRPVFDAAWNSGYATMKHDDSLYVSRYGFVEETFFNWAIIPLVGGDGTVVALYNPAFENTRRKISERRMLTLREVGITTAQARDVKGFWIQLQKGLEYNERDVPFALIYSVAEDSESEVSSLASGNLAHPPSVYLAGSIGVPDGHPCAATSIDLRTSDEGFAPYMRESMAHPANPVVLSEADGTFPTELTRGLSWRGFGDPCHSIVVFPVHPTTANDVVVGFIILGINPRRRYDEDYQLFINLLSRQLATSLASVVLFEEEIQRGQKAARLAALDRQELSLQLRLRTQEAVESEYRFTRMAEFGPVGLFIADNRGHIDYCNEMWYRISGLQRNASTFTAWMQSIRDEDRPDTERAWRRLVEDKVAITHEFRFKGSRELIDGHMVDVWALMSAYPERDESGQLKSIFGCITDISQQKWAQDVQKQRREEAVELKRQQENFIDITSHEMRNPLSAILQCADEISAGLSRYKLEDPAVHAPGALNLLIDSCVEAANIISLCANHQKRIVDDILTLSKLDSNLLLVTPVDVQPVVVVQDVLKMFETELHSNGIDSRLTIEQSYHDLGVDWVKLDPSRLRQVLINLMTNAIKFTQGRPTRSIVITLGASKNIVLEENGFSYVPLQQPVQEDLTDDADWADGEKINLHVAVADTGSGLDEHEKQLLFQRFSQTSPRTHVQYGGSGLGLFICRILTELQGGQIAVQSEKGQGSTFAFYIKGRKSDHAQVESPVRTPLPRDIPPFSSPMRAAASAAADQTPGSVIIASPTDESTNALANASTNEAAAQPLPSPSSGQPGGPCRLDVLIVEDNLVNQKVLNRQLQLSGNNTYVANHGGEALAQLRRSRFWNSSALVQSESAAAAAETTSGTAGEGTGMGVEMGVEMDVEMDVDHAVNISVILMDLEMPVMDGMTCTREIRRLERAGVITQHLPIIAVTAYARPEQVESFKAAGVDDVISKPFRISELIPKIEELVHKYNVLPTP